jgi:RimJ/RimL family protein N-acetyltransferase
MADRPEHPPTIELDGARLRPLRASDAPALYDYLRDPAVTELTGYPEITPPLVEGLIERSVARWAAGEPAKWGVVGDDDRVVGTCGFNEWSPAHRWAELAYDLAQSHWGRGLMRQALSAVLEWIFRPENRVDRVHAYTRTDNLRSQRLLERSGFLREGCLRSFRVCRGEPRDFYVYGLLRSDWTK